MSLRSLALAVAGLLGLGALALAGTAPAGAAPAVVREDALKELGRRLFFDPAASRVGMRSCADCHDPAHGYSDGETVSLDDVGTTRRHAQTIVDAADLRAAHWDGEFERVEDVVRSRLEVTLSRGGPRYPTQSPREESDARKAKDAGLLAAEATPATPDVPVFGAPVAEIASLPPPDAARGPIATGATLPGFVDPETANSLPDAAARLSASGLYAEGFEAAFGSTEVTTDRIACALQRYCAGVASGESAYDRFAAGRTDALSDAAKRGLALFRGAAGCATCHRMDGPRATFSDGDFHDTGVSWRAIRGDAERHFGGDLGHGRHEHRLRYFRAFKTPTLREVARRGPYMHDGSLATLTDVVARYAEGPGSDPRIDPAFPKVDARGTQVADLVAFLESLSSERRPGLAPSAWARRAKETRLVFVDADGTPLTDVAVELVPAGDVLPGLAAADLGPARLTTAKDGSVAFAPPRTTHTRALLDGDLAPWSGVLVPDTCREARVRVPVRGRAEVKVRFPKDAHPPTTFLGRLFDATVFPGRRPVVSVFSRRSVAASEGDGVEAVYDTPFRTDAPPAVDLLIPDAAAPPRATLDPATPAVVTIR